MMENNESIDRFNEELKKPFEKRYMSEEELAYVFDIAGDDHNEYVRLEALLLGARLYPDSLKMLERRAIYYLDTNLDLFVAFMKDNADASSTLFDILRLNLYDENEKEEAQEYAARLLEEITFTEDEEIIQLIAGAHDLGLDQWLVDNFETFKNKAPYLPTVLYEFGYMASENTDEQMSKLAVKALEELTEIEPYDPAYWDLLGGAYLNAGHPEDASSAIDYALAINPKDETALRTKFLIATVSDDLDGMISAAREVLEAVPDDVQAGTFLATMTRDSEEKRRVIDSLPLATKAAPMVIRNAIKINHPDISALIKNAFEYGQDDIDFWQEMADYAFEVRHFDIIPLIFRIFEEEKGEPLNHDFLLLKIMFESGNYDVVANIFVSEESNGTLRRPEHLYEGFSLFIVALLRMGEYQQAASAATELLKLLNSDNSLPGSELERNAMRDFISDILKRLGQKRKTNWDNFRPITL